jgi:predicted nucleotidyltransferase
MKRLYSATQEERTRIVNELADALARESNIAFAYVYGSFLDADSFHDVDIGVYVRHDEASQETPYALDLGQRLAGGIPFPLDVRILNHAPVSFLYHVLKGRPLYIQDDERLTTVMERVVCRYLDMAPLLRQSTRDAFTG